MISPDRYYKLSRLVLGYVAIVFALLFSTGREMLSAQPDWINLVTVVLMGLGVTRIAAARTIDFELSNPWLCRILTLSLTIPAIGMIVVKFVDVNHRFVVFLVIVAAVVVGLKIAEARIQTLVNRDSQW